MRQRHYCCRQLHGLHKCCCSWSRVVMGRHQGRLEQRDRCCHPSIVLCECNHWLPRPQLNDFSDAICFCCRCTPLKVNQHACHPPAVGGVIAGPLHARTTITKLQFSGDCCAMQTVHLCQLCLTNICVPMLLLVGFQSQLEHHV